MNSNPILAELTDLDISRLVAAGEVRAVEPGVEIIREGVETPWLFILVSGKLEVEAGLMHTHLADLYPGQLVGEMAFVDKRASSAVVRVKEASSLLAISRPAIEALITSDPSFGVRFFRGIASLVIRRLRSTIRTLAYHEPEEPNSEIVVDRRFLDAIAAKRG